MGKFCKENMDGLLQVFSRLVRLSGEPEAEEACRYITGKLEEYGVPYQLYTVPLYVSNPIEASVKVTVAGETVELAALPRSFSGDCRQGLTGPIFYDTKAFEPMGKMEMDAWYAGVKGKIILSSNFYEDYVQRILSYGAIGLVHAWTSDEDILHNETVCPVWGTAEPETACTLPNIPVVGVLCKAGEALFSRLVPGVNEGEATIYSAVDHKCTKATFPVAELPGENDQYVLVGNHFDSWHEGVTDNATGNALALELARILKGEKRYRGVKVAWWPAHSNGRYAGSTWYCDTHYMDLKENCVALVNIDSPGSKGAVEVGIATSGTVSDWAADVIRKHTGQLEVDVHKLPRGSDLSFFGAEVPIQLSFDYYQGGADRGRWNCAGSGGGWWWHTVEDTYDKVDLSLLCRDGEIALDMVSGLMNAPILPFDWEACVGLMEETIETIDSASDPAFDLAPAKAAVAELKEALASCPFLGDEDYQKVGGRLTMLLCSAAGPYHFDNTFAVGRLPGLQCVANVKREETPDRDFLFLETKFRRQRNRFVAEMADIVQIIRHLQ